MSLRKIIRKTIRKPLTEIQHEQGYAYLASTYLPLLSSHQSPSRARVLEDGIPLAGPDNLPHDDIRLIGCGRFSFWHDKVYFSAHDNSDPRINGRHYEMEYSFADGSKMIDILRRVRNWFRGGEKPPINFTVDVPVNFFERDSSPKSIQRDVESAVQIGQNFIRLFPEGGKNLQGKVVLEIGPGINFGSTLLMASLGARAMVSDLYLSPWNATYHPKFYEALRRWIRENLPHADLTPLDRILETGGYPLESIECYSTPLEELAGIEDESIDIIFSNAVLEHLQDPGEAFRQLARVSKPGALGYHQVDFRDHNNPNRPLEYLLIADKEFAMEFKQKHGERGNRFRPHEYWKMFEQFGFEVQRFEPSCLAEDSENWEKYVKEQFSEERVQISKEHMLDFLKMQDLVGKTFLDIGCGSGLHSMAALKAGAKRVVSFDYDPRSVSTAKLLHTYAGKPENWEVKQGSILDMQYIATLEPVDIVYSWGVLHHTGSMWQALENTKKLMKEKAVLYIALYGDDLYFGQPKNYWSDIKKRYNLAGRFQKKYIELWYFWEFYLNKNWRNFPSLLKQAREYRKKIRGMDIYRDAVDWLGGWPFEYASVSEVKDFASSRMGLELINLATGQACIEYLFSFPDPDL